MLGRHDSDVRSDFGEVEALGLEGMGVGRLGLRSCPCGGEDVKDWDGESAMCFTGDSTRRSAKTRI